MKVEVSGHKFDFPRVCACCGRLPQTTLSATASKTSGKTVVTTSSRSWEFPYCAGCVAHVKVADRPRHGAIIALIPTVLASLLIAGNISSTLGLAVFIAGSIGSLVVYIKLRQHVEAMRVPSCSCLRFAVHYHGWESTRHTFYFVSTSYANLFMVANLQKLINVSPDAWQWLKSNGYVVSPNQPQSARRDIR